MIDGNAIVPVTQADRDSAAYIWANYVARTGEVMAERAIREGASDDTMIVQAFARHRLSQSTIYVQWSDDGKNIRKWSHEPFEDGAPMSASPPAATANVLAIAEDRADWLLDAVACATQNRMFLRGDSECDEVACDAILMNGEKAIRLAIQGIAA